METKAIIVRLIQEKKRYWGKLLYENYFMLFQKIHSNAILAELISTDLGISISAKQVENIKKNYQRKTKCKAPEPPIEKENTSSLAQSIYENIYTKSKDSAFDLNNL